MSTQSSAEDTPAPTTPDDVPGITAVNAAPRSRSVPSRVPWLGLGLAVVGLLMVVMLWQKVGVMQRQLAQQSAEATRQSLDANTLARQAADQARDMATRFSSMDARVAGLVASREQMEEMVQRVSRARDENLATELETAVRVAQDQAQLTGSAEPLLAALRTAERRIEQSSDPLLGPVAWAVTDDLQHVRNARVVDTVGLLSRLDRLIHRADQVPLASAPPIDRLPPSTPSEQPPLSSWWGQLIERADGWLRVSRIDHLPAMTLGPEQGFLLRENLKLRLQGARLSILARQYDSARSDLQAARGILDAWFDPQAQQTLAFDEQLKLVDDQMQSVELPRVDQTLSALAKVVAAQPR